MVGAFPRVAGHAVIDYLIDMAIYIVTWDFSTKIRTEAVYKKMAEAARDFCTGYNDNSVEVTQTTWAIDTEEKAGDIYEGMLAEVETTDELVAKGNKRDYLLVYRLQKGGKWLKWPGGAWLKSADRRWG